MFFFIRFWRNLTKKDSFENLRVLIIKKLFVDLCLQFVGFFSWIRNHPDVLADLDSGKKSDPDPDKKTRIRNTALTNAWVKPVLRSRWSRNYFQDAGTLVIVHCKVVI